MGVHRACFLSIGQGKSLPRSGIHPENTPPILRILPLVAHQLAGTGNPLLVATWAYSNYPFVLALPFERTEAILEGTAAAFDFFGSPPKKSGGTTPRPSQR